MPRNGALAAAAAAVVAVFGCAALSGCASATTGSGSDAADLTAIVDYSTSSGIDPELVFTTEVEGYDLAPQSVGATPGRGIQATWVNNGTGAMLTVRSDRGELTAASCAATALWDAPDVPVTCTEEDGLWHRVGGDVHEYVAVRDDAMILITGANGTTPADLLDAAKAVRVPSETELELLFSDAPDFPAEPVERGDLPENGDGAPIDPSGPGG